MIRFFDKKDTDPVVAIWKEAFHDNEQDIMLFLERFSKCMLVYEEDERAVSMLTLIPVTLDGQKGRYVYAVATDKKYRMRGFAGALIGYSKEYIKENGEKFLVILPQNDGLYGFYGNFGFVELYCTKRFEKTVSATERSDFKAEKISAEEYFDLRKRHFSGRNYVEWDVGILRFFEEMYNGSYIKISDAGNTVAAAFCYLGGEKVIIPELLTDRKTDNIIDAVAGFFAKGKTVGMSADGNGERFGMIYPEEYRNSYFGIGMN